MSAPDLEGLEDQTLTLDHVCYRLWPLKTLDENLRTCVPEHRDALLDARLMVTDTIEGLKQS